MDATDSLNEREILKDWAIGLTGGIACGKSTIAGLIREQGLMVVDADALARLVVEPGSDGLAAVVEAFGHDIISGDGTMDRQRMRAIVFADPKLRLKLEAIIHPRLQALLMQVLIDAGFQQRPRLWFYEASLIYERQRAAEFKQVWVAYCSIELQVTRLMLRDQCTRSLAEAMLAAQMPARTKADLADRVIDTDCSRDELKRRVLEALAPLSSSI